MNPDKHPDLPEKYQLLFSANLEAAKEMDVETMGIVVLEGVFNLLLALGTEVDERMGGLGNEALIEMGNTENGRTVLGCMTEFVIAITTIIASIDQIRETDPKKYDKILTAFKNTITNKMAEKEDAIVEEFMRSIPDTLPPEDAASK